MVVEAPSGVEFLIGEWHGVMAFCEEDGSYDVEVLNDLDGALRSARIEFVNDIPTLDGEWSDWQELTITTGRVAACDPYCLSSAVLGIAMRTETMRARVEQLVESLAEPPKLAVSLDWYH